MSSCLSPAPCTPFPPRFWLRYRSVLVRLAYPVSVIVTTTSSRAIRSSSLTSPSAATMRVRRSSPCFSTISAEFVAHDPALPLGLGQDVFQVGDLGLDLGEVVDDALALQGRQAPQLHVEDRLGLDLVDVEQLDQAGPGDVDGLRRPDQRDDFVQRVERFDQTAQNVGAFIGLAQPVRRAPDDDVELVLDVVTGSSGPAAACAAPRRRSPACWRRSWSAAGCACRDC